MTTPPMITVKYPIRLSILAALLMLALVAAIVLSPTSTFAGNNAEIACEGISGTGCDAAEGEEGVGRIVGAAIQILSIVVGAASIFVILLSGFKYITSAGDPAGIKRARETLIYAVVGLIIALLTMVFVNFALSTASV